MVDQNKSDKIGPNGLSFQYGVHMSSGAAAPTHTAPEGSRYWREGTDNVYWQDGPGDDSNWILIGPSAVNAHISNFTNYIPPSWSGAIPLTATIFDTRGTMHDGTVGDSGTATGTQSTTTLQDTGKSWTVDQFANHYVRTTGGTGKDRWRKIASNTSDTLTISPVWTVTPDATTTYEITELSTRLVAPSDGIYLAVGQVGFEKPIAAMTSYGIRIDVNGSFKAVIYRSTSANTEHELTISKPFEMVAGDYAEIQAYQGVGSEIKMYGSSRMFFSLIKQ